MADKPRDKKAEGGAEKGAGDAAGAAKKKPPIKMIGIIAGVMVLEAAALMLLLGAGGPAKGEASEKKAEVATDHSEETEEIAVVDEKFQNLQTGQVWVWDVSVFVRVKAKNVASVERQLERRSAEIKEGIGQIFSRAQHAQLKEPERQTLNRQLAAFFEEVFGVDAEGKALVERVLIPKCRGFPAGF